MVLIRLQICYQWLQCHRFKQKINLLQWKSVTYVGGDLWGPDLSMYSLTNTELMSHNVALNTIHSCRVQT